MADDRPPTDGASDEVGRDPLRLKRAAPTLDLSATEIPPASEATEPPPHEEPAAEPTADAAPEPPSRPRRQSTILIPALAGAAAAAFIMIVISLAGWPVGTPTTDVASPAPANTAALDDLAARLARVEARPATTAPAVPAAPTPSLAPRIDALDKTVAALREDIAANRTRGEQALATVSELKTAPPVAPPPDLSAITSRLTQLESAVRAQATAIAQQAAKPADDAPLRRAMAAALLDMQVRQGQPYAAALKAAAPDPARAAPLDAFASTGVPSAATLCQELLALLPKLKPAAPAAAAAPPSGLFDRLKASATHLVKIEHSDAADDAGSGAVVRIATAARRNDLAAARRDFAALPAADRTVLQPWIDRADAREAALAASQQLATDAMSTLAKPAP